MEKMSFKISTLHRSRYMLLMMGMVLLLVYAVSRLPLSEVVKIVGSLFLIPVILFIAVKFSKNPSTCILDDKSLIIQNNSSSKTVVLLDIKYIRNLRRSGGNLLIIKLKNKSNIRIWRNKLFEAEDDLKSLCDALKEKGIEYYDM